MPGADVRATAWPDEFPELVPLAPLVVTVWSDAALSAEELRAFGGGASGLAFLSSEARGQLDRWLDPADPPSPRDLVRLRRSIRRSWQEIPQGAGSVAPTSLAALGDALWQVRGGGPPWDDEGPMEQLTQIESALDVLGGEAARRVLGGTAAVLGPRKGLRAGDVAPPTTEDASRLAAYLDRDHTEVRRSVFALLQRDDLAIPLGLPTDEYRDRVLAAVRCLADEGLGSMSYPSAYGGRDDPGASVAAFETLAFGDLSVLVKFGVQFGLFGGSIHQLGTERHHEAYLPDVGSLALPGCYAMTETGHGSNVRDLETTATYDAETRDLVVHTPTPDAAKDWIGNAARDGRLATVFARLIVEGDDHGVHAVLVPIRGQDGAVIEGVTIEDRGLKLGLNGVDNGRISFDGVRVPVDNLLDRFASIDEQGRYHSPIPSDGRRFFTMLGTLVAGRVSIAAASVSASKLGLTIAVRYTSRRRQFGPSGAQELPILSYLALQRTLIPGLATTYGLHFAVRGLQESYAAGTGEDGPELEVMAAGLKAYASEHCSRILAACRQACGGQGYLAENRLGALKADTDVFTTFEGANLVLYQLVAKGLLSRYRDEMVGLDLRGAIRYLGERAETSLTELNPVVKRRTEPDHLVDPAFYLAALRYREERLLRSAAARLRSRIRDGVDSFLAVDEVQDHLIALARAYVERVVGECLDQAVAPAPTPGSSEVLKLLAALNGLTSIERDRAWFLEAGYLEPVKSRAIRAQVNELCTDVASCAPELVDAFGIPEGLLPRMARRGEAAGFASDGGVA